MWACTFSLWRWGTHATACLGENDSMMPSVSQADPIGPLRMFDRSITGLWNTEVLLFQEGPVHFHVIGKSLRDRSRGDQSLKMGVFPFNPPLRTRGWVGDSDSGTTL